MADRTEFIEQVYAHVADNGPIVAGDLKQRVGKKGSWWDYDDGKIALEALFHEGRVAARRRPNDFARLYDVAERMIPAHVLARPAMAEREARKELLVLAAKHYGVGTLGDLADYHRQLTPPCRPLIAELVEEGRLVRCRRRGVVAAGLSAPRRGHPATHPGPRPAQPVRPGRLEP